MSGVNRVIIVGRLGVDPKVSTTQTGQNVCTLSIATSETWVKDGKKEEKTEWHSVVLWARLAELAGKYLKKGRNVYIEGRLQTRSWPDKDNPKQTRYKTEIICTNMQFIDGQGQNSSDSARDSGDAPSLESGSGDPFYSKENTSHSVGNGAASLAPMDDIPF